MVEEREGLKWLKGLNVPAALQAASCRAGDLTRRKMAGEVTGPTVCQCSSRSVSGINELRGVALRATTTKSPVRVPVPQFKRNGNEMDSLFTLLFYANPADWT